MADWTPLTSIIKTKTAKNIFAQKSISCNILHSVKHLILSSTEQSHLKLEYMLWLQNCITFSVSVLKKCLEHCCSPDSWLSVRNRQTPPMSRNTPAKAGIMLTCMEI